MEVAFPIVLQDILGLVGWSYVNGSLHSQLRQNNSCNIGQLVYVKDFDTSIWHLDHANESKYVWYSFVGLCHVELECVTKCNSSCQT